MFGKESEGSPTGTKPPWGLENGLVFIQGLTPVELQGGSGPTALLLY